MTKLIINLVKENFSVISFALGLFLISFFVVSFRESIVWFFSDFLYSKKGIIFLICILIPQIYLLLNIDGWEFQVTRLNALDKNNDNEKVITFLQGSLELIKIILVTTIYLTLMVLYSSLVSGCWSSSICNI